MLAILLRTGTRQASVFEIAQKVFEQSFILNGFKKNDPAGIAESVWHRAVKAIELQAMIELGHVSINRRPLKWKVFLAVKS